jgi:hypothetical protein
MISTWLSFPVPAVCELTPIILLIKSPAISAALLPGWTLCRIFNQAHDRPACAMPIPSIALVLSSIGIWRQSALICVKP